MHKHKQREKCPPFKLTYKLSRLLVAVRMGKSCIILAPRNILKHRRVSRS